MNAIPALGSFRSLLPWESDALLAHFDRLPAEDLRLRFCSLPKHEVLEEYAQDPLQRDRQVIGWFHDGILRGTAELRFGKDDVEVALTVEPEFRCNGIGGSLMRRAKLRARAFGIRKLRIFTGRNNGAMVKVARKAGLEMTLDGGDVEGVVTLRPGVMAFWTDLIEEEAGQLTNLFFWPRAVAARSAA